MHGSGPWARSQHWCLCCSSPVAQAAPGWLGIGIGEITAEKVSELKLQEERGVEILTVMPDSPAQKAGLKEHDVVLEYSGIRVDSAQQFQRLVRETPAGRTVPLVISRDGATQTFEVTLGQRYRGRLAQPGSKEWKDLLEEFTIHIPKIEIPDLPGIMVFSGASRLGIDGESLTEQLGAYFGVPDGKGVLVRSVDRSSPASKAGIQAGDVIVKLDGERVESVRDLRSLLREKSGKGHTRLPATLIRNKQEKTVNVNLADSKQESKLHRKSRRLRQVALVRGPTGPARSNFGYFTISSNEEGGRSRR